MKIQSIVLSNFKSFSATVCLDNISDGTNILLGKNGAGKSSIISAIQFVITPHWRISLAERKAMVSESSPDIHSYVEIVFENADKAFPAGSTVTIRRTVTQKAEEYCVDGHTVTREEMASLFSTVGITRAVPYYIVEQGKIGQLSHMNGTERMNLIREMAGQTMYEQNKEEGERALASSQEIEQKIQRLLEEVEQRVSAAENAKRAKRERDELERKKRLVIREVYKRDLNKIKAKLEEVFEEESAFDTTANENVNMLQAQLESLLSQIPLDNDGSGTTTAPAPTMDELASMEKELEEKKRKAQALRQDISRLESLCTIQESAGEEISALRAQGADAVNRKISSIRKELSEQSLDKQQAKKEALLEERRSIWKEEKDAQKRRKSLEKEMQDRERAFLVSSSAFFLESEMQTFPGVLGYVYSLVSIPSEIVVPLAQAQSHLLTSIVVSDRESAFALVRAYKIDRTVIPLSCIEKRKSRQIPLASLSSYISSADRYAHLVEYLFGAIYYVPDFDTALAASRKYKINVITAAGEYFSSTGTVTAGESAGSSKFLQYVRSREEYRKCLAQESETKRRRKENEAACSAFFSSETRTAFYLHDLIYLLENEDVDAASSLLEKRVQYEQEVLPSLYSAEQRYISAREKRESAEVIESTKKKAADIENRLARIIGSSKWNDKVSERGRLESRYRRLQKKILSLNAEDVEAVEIAPTQTLVLSEATRDVLAEALSYLQKQVLLLPEESGQPEHLVAEYMRIMEKITELQKAKKKITEMQLHLEAHKEEITNITVQQVRENLAYFFRTLTHGIAHVTADKQNTTLNIEVSFSGEACVSQEELSGGQRSILALCMILSLQSIYPAPFYLLDEFDANLDVHFLQSIVGSGILEGKQLFISTFRKETLLLGKKFFHIVNHSVDECSLSEARDLLSSYIPQPEQA